MSRRVIGSDPRTWTPTGISGNVVLASSQDRVNPYDDPMVLAAKEQVPAVSRALEQLDAGQKRTLIPSDLVRTAEILSKTYSNAPKTNETNNLAVAQVLEEILCFAKALGEYEAVLKEMLGTTLSHHVGMNQADRLRLFMTMLAPGSASAVGFTPIEAPPNTAIRKYPVSVTVSTDPATTLLQVYLPALIEQYTDNGCFIYIEGYQNIPGIGKVLREDHTTNVIPTVEARWGHFSSAFSFRNVNAAVSTLGTLSATALAPTGAGLATLTESTLVNAVRNVKDRNVRVQSQGRECNVRNDVVLENFAPRSVSSNTQAFFSETIQQVSNVTEIGIGTTPGPSVNLRLAVVPWQTAMMSGAQDNTPYLSSNVSIIGAIFQVIIGNAGAGYADGSIVTFNTPVDTRGYAAAGTLSVTNGGVTGIQLTSRGAYYSASDPPVATLAVAGGAVINFALSGLGAVGDQVGIVTPYVQQPAGIEPISGVTLSNPIFMGNAYPSTGFPYAANTTNPIKRLLGVDMTSNPDGEPILGVKFRIRGSATLVKPVPTPTDGATPPNPVVASVAPQYLFIFAIAETKNGVCYGMPYNSASPDQPIYIPSPWVQGSQTDNAYTNGLDPNLPQSDIGVMPENYAIIPLSGVSYFGGSVAPVPFDATIEIDNTKGYIDGSNGTAIGSGNGFWPVAYGCTDGTSNTSSSATSRKTLNDAVSNGNGRSLYNVNNVTRFTGFKAYEIEKIHLYGMVLGAAGAVGSSSQKFSEYNLSMDQYDLNDITIETIQNRYQPMAQQRMATLIASNSGAQQFGIQCDVNVNSAPKVDEIQAFPVPDFPVKCADLSEMLRVIPNANMGRLIESGR